MTNSAGDKMVTKIHDKWYDLTEFEKLHPGGPVALGLAYGRDATVMFESHHPFTPRGTLDAILRRYELDESSARNLKTLEEQHGIPDHPFNWKSDFGDALKFHVKEYFQAEAKRRNVSLVAATKATPERWFEIAMLGAIFVSTLVSFVCGEWSSLLTFPVSAWLFSVNTFHDAAHFALHRNWRINSIVPYLYPFFSSPFAWYHQHNIGHHSYTNVGHRDPDLVHYFWFKREHKSVEWKQAHKLQRSYIFQTTWWVMAVEAAIATMNDLWMVVYGVYNDSVPMKQVSRKRMFCHLLGRVLVVGLIHTWPFFVFNSWIRCIIFAKVPVMVYSFLFMMNTQINHLTPETAHESHEDWYKHQVVTAHDFGVNSRFCFLLSGGLNFQVIHHLFPTVNHCHLVKLQPIISRLCEKHDVEYKQVVGYIAAIKAHHRHTVDMSSSSQGSEKPISTS
ncbi:hypothetical protein R1flu_007237 [Riccia fluitans]|uniref:Cytochrome b5 heme-binding domain-containing protein n=1 Tax=Riccia fluitans TaxID=41844 RepID=A0ABD1YYI1_9MARC